MIKYYTDFHDVDEDIRTICTYDGSWIYENNEGIMYRYMTDTPILASGVVAYKDKNTTLSARMVFLMI